jgi:FixJ family two-component response regulator
VAIHVVEDDHGVRDSLLMLLRQHGHDARGWLDGESFMRAARPGPRDTVIVDLLLPGISGAGLIRWLRDRAPAPRIIAMTGQPQRLIDAETHDLGLSTIVRKPLNEEALLPLL